MSCMQLGKWNDLKSRVGSVQHKQLLALYSYVVQVVVYVAPFPCTSYMLEIILQV